MMTQLRILSFFATVICAASSATTNAQIVAINDNFEAGEFSSDWDAVEGQSIGVIESTGQGAGGSDAFARVGGVTGSAGGLGVTLFDVDGSATAARGFEISLDFRIDPVVANRRMINVMVNTNSNDPTATGSTVNLRYWNNSWQAYNGDWTPIGLPQVTPNTWHSLTLTGNDWGTGTVGQATWDVQLNGTGLNGLQIFQNDADASGARSVSLNDRWDGHEFDVDNVMIMATPGATANNTVVVIPTNPVAYSGIYPHTAVSNTHNEAAVGALVNRNGKAWFVTYGPHLTTGSSDELYSVDLNSLEMTTWRDYPGNTNANRYTDSNLGIDVVGAAYIDTNDNIRYLPATSPSAGHLVGRITGTAAHLTDPNKLYYMTMEEGLYEVDFSDLTAPIITTIRSDGNHDSAGGIQKNLPGVHGKGLYTGQGHLFFTNNGADSNAQGGLVEWDGTGDAEQLSSWTVVDDTAQYTEVTSRRGPGDMDPASTDAIWATGWDDESLLINTRDAANGTWTKFRLPKGSYTHGHPNGWYTEWPRIRDVGLEGGQLLSHHGMLFLVPETFSAGDYGGIKPIGIHHKMIVDYVDHGDQIIIAGNDATRFNNSLVPKSNSNIMFVNKSDVRDYGGNPRGFGGVWIDEGVTDGEVSDAFLIGGFRDRVIHFRQGGTNAVSFAVEIDADGNGNWKTHETVDVGGANTASGGYGYYIVPRDLAGQWLRIRSEHNISSATAYLHLSNGSLPVDQAITESLAKAAVPVARSQGLLRSTGSAGFELEFAADRLDASGQIIGNGYYQARLNPVTAALELVSVNDPIAEQAVRSQAATSQDFGVDAASVYIEKNGTRYRLPKGDSAFDNETASGWRRGEREVVTERAVMNIHGTIYELPRNFDGGGIQRMVPITTHNLDIFDFASWRGMLVLSGVVDGGSNDGHYVESDDGRVGLWFGNVDDLWKFGAPRGEGGPWNNTAVQADIASDPFLMAGYEHKTLALSHDARTPVDFTVEVDFLGTGQWNIYDTLTVAPGETLEHVFNDGFSAHWVRLKSGMSTKATAWFTYTAIALPGDYNGDGTVDDADYGVWRSTFGSDTNLAADGNGDGHVGAADYTVWRNNLGLGNSTSTGVTGVVPEPSAAAIAGTITLLLIVRFARSH